MTSIRTDHHHAAIEHFHSVHARPDDAQLHDMHVKTGIPLESLRAARDAKFEKAVDAVAHRGDATRTLRAATDDHHSSASFEGVHAAKTGAGVTNAYSIRMHGGTAAEPPPLLEGIHAARSGNIKQLEHWIKIHGDIHQRDANGLTVLDHAAVTNHADAVKVLVEKLKNDPKRNAVLLPPPTANLPSPLQLAAQGNSVEAAKVLLAAEPALLNHVWGLNGHTALVEATFNNHVEMVELLLAQEGVDAGALTVRGLSSSDLAARAVSQDPRAAKILAALNAHNKALTNVAAAGQPARFDLSPDEKKQRLTTLLNAIEPTPRASNAAYDELISVVQKQPAPDATPAQKAELEAGLLKDVKRILDGNRGINLNALGQQLGTTPLIEASVRGYTSVVKELLARGADPLVHEEHPMGITAMFKAAVFGHVEIASMLIENVRQRHPERLAEAVNEQGPANGLTPLHDALLRASVDVAELLLTHGARTDVLSHAGKTQKDLIASNPAIAEKVRAAPAKYPHLKALL